MEGESEEKVRNESETPKKKRECLRTLKSPL